MAQSGKISAESYSRQKTKLMLEIFQIKSVKLARRIGQTSDFQWIWDQTWTEKGKIRWVKVPYMSAPEALNSVKGIGPFGPKPPKFGGSGIRAP